MFSIVVSLLISTLPYTQASHPQDITQDQLEVWLDDLGDPAYEVRRAAVKELYAAGPAALEALAEVSEGDDFEAALRARNLIQRIHKLFFVGAKIELSASQKQFRWDEPVSLRVKIINPSDFPIHLPFLIRNRESIDTDPLAVQMGNMLDAADFLRLIGPDSKPLDLHVDDIRGQPQLEAALDMRVYAEPASLLAPHSEFVLTLPTFNRGLARYRMLNKGAYRLQFAYVPEWDHHKMREDGIGKVTSNQLVMTVTQSAPDLILGAGREIQTSLQQVGREIIVRLTNTHDRTIGVNLNLGGKALVDYSHLEWQWKSPHGVVRAQEPIPNPPPLDADKLIKLKPAKSVEVFRIRPGELSKLKGFEQIKPQDGLIRLAVRYSNTLDRAVLLSRLQQDQPNKKKWQVLYQAMPLPTFVGSRTSDFIEISPGTP